MESYNYVKEHNRATPRYSMTGKETSIEVYFNDKEEVLIVGVVDNNYVHWVSFTNSEDRERNAQIFDYISKGEIIRVTQLYKALREIGLEYGEVKRWLHISLTRDTQHRMRWNTPFGYGYGDKPGQLENNGRFFAKDIAVYYKRVQQRCRLREAGGAYEKVLDNYLKVLKADEGRDDYYQRVKDLIEIIRQEDYLYASPDPVIRRKYTELMEIGDRLYNRFMSVARG